MSAYGSSSSSRNPSTNSAGAPIPFVMAASNLRHRQPRKSPGWWYTGQVPQVEESSEPLLNTAQGHARARSKVSRGGCGAWCGFMLWWFNLLAVWAFCGYFCYYIATNFFLKPMWSWDTIQNFSIGKRPYPMLVHWIGGSVVMAIGPLQLIPQIRRRTPWLHRWVGRIYLVAAIVTSLAGATYIVLCGTVGGISMDASFMLYGILLGSCAVMAWRRAKQLDFRSHREWAVRTFVLGVGSALYRLEVFPLFIGVLPGLSHDTKILWLNVAAWLFYLPQLVLAEVCMWWWWRRCVDTQSTTTDKPPPPTPHRRDSLGHSPRSHSPPLSHDPDSQQLDSSRRTTPGAAAPASPVTPSPVAAVVTIATSPGDGAGAGAGAGVTPSVSPDAAAPDAGASPAAAATSPPASATPWNPAMQPFARRLLGTGGGRAAMTPGMRTPGTHMLTPGLTPYSRVQSPELTPGSHMLSPDTPLSGVTGNTRRHGVAAAGRHSSLPRQHLSYTEHDDADE